MRSAKTNSIYKIIIAVIALLMAVMAIVIWVYPPSLYPDPVWGFRVLQGMKNGGGFNILTTPAIDNLAKNTSSFLTWWSPGQYLTPYFFQSLFGISLSHASVLTIIFGNFLGLTGFYFFFLKARFTKNLAAISLLFIVLQEAFWTPYAYYTGGEVLLFGFLGWFLLGCISFNKIDAKTILFIILSGWIGFFCKSSFMWIYASGLLCLWLRLTTGLPLYFERLKKGVILAIPAVISLGVIYVLYLSKGENPASISGGFKLSFQAITYPIAAPLLSGFSFDDLFNGLIDGDNWFTPAEIVPLLALLAILSVLLIIEIVRQLPHKDYRRMLVIFYGMAILFFSYSFLRQTTISYEARHLRVIGLLMTPGLIYLVGLSKTQFRVVFFLLCIPITYKSFNYAIKTLPANKNGAHASTGFSQQFIDQPSLDYMLNLDKINDDAVFVFNTADVSLEIQHHRSIVITDPDNQSEATTYSGHAGPLYMLLPAGMSATEVAKMYKCFPGYQNFSVSRLTKDYLLYTAQ